MEGTACLTGARTAWTASKIWLLFLVPYNCLPGLNHLGPHKGHSNLSFTVYYLLTTRFIELKEPLSPIYRWLFLLLHSRKSAETFPPCPGAPLSFKMFIFVFVFIFEYERVWNIFTIAICDDREMNWKEWALGSLHWSLTSKYSCLHHCCPACMQTASLLLG